MRPGFKSLASWLRAAVHMMLFANTLGPTAGAPVQSPHVPASTHACVAPYERGGLSRAPAHLVACLTSDGGGFIRCLHLTQLRVRLSQLGAQPIVLVGLGAQLRLRAWRKQTSTL